MPSVSVVPLFVRVPGRLFSAAQAGELDAVLRDSDDSTIVADLSSEDDLLLRENGVTNRGYRLTRQAFYYVASRLSPGLSRCLADLSGTVPASDGGLSFAAREAIALWNAAVLARFGRLSMHRLVRNESSRRIDGVIGPKHQYLGNYAFYREVLESLTASRREYGTSFYAAKLAGGRFSLWFRDAEPAFSVAVDDQLLPFYEGRYFTNGEAAGTAVRGTLAVYTRFGVSLASYAVAGRRLTHRGKKFRAGVSKAIEDIVGIEWDRTRAAEEATASLLQPLGFLATMSSQQLRDRRKSLLHSLSLAGVGRTDAADVLAAALQYGRGYTEQSLPDPGSLPDGVGRTLFDLFVPLQVFARRSGGVAREQLEMAAYEMLTCRFFM